LPFSITSRVIPAASITCRSSMIVFWLAEDIWVSAGFSVLKISSPQEEPSDKFCPP
jgi:hypothetical protein